MCSTTHLGSQFNASGGWLASVDWRARCAPAVWATGRSYAGIALHGQVCRPVHDVSMAAWGTQRAQRRPLPQPLRRCPAEAQRLHARRGPVDLHASPRSDERRHQAVRHHQVAAAGGAPGWAGCGGGFEVGRHDCWCSPIAPLGLGDPRRQRPRTPSGGYSVYHE